MRWLFWLSMVVSLAAPAAPSRILTAPELQKLKMRPCTFVHVWAGWCSICMQEMPHLIPVLARMKKVTPVVLDVSEPMMQQYIGLKWKVLLTAPFTTYRRPKVNEKSYLRAIDRQIGDSLPYSVLYNRGKRLKAWTGELDLSRLPGEIENLCH